MAGGLLDFLETPEGQGLLAATFGGLAGAQRGTPVNNIGRAGLAGLSGYSGAQDRITQAGLNAEKQKYVQSQIDENTSQAAQRNAAMAKQAETQNLLKSIFGGGTAPATSPGAFTPNADGMGPTMPQTMQPQGGGLSGMSIDQVGALKAMGGPDLLDAYKFAKDPMQMQQGSTYIDRVTGKQTFMPKVGEGVAPNAQGVYAPLPGYGDSLAGIEGAKQQAIERVKAGYDLKEVRGPDGAMRPVSKLEVLRQNSGGNQSTAQPPRNASPFASTPSESDRMMILNQEYNKAVASGDYQTVVNLTKEVNNLPKSERRPFELKKSVQLNEPFTTTASDSQVRLNAADNIRAVDSSKAGTDRIMTGYDNARTAVEQLISNTEARKSIAGGSFQGSGADTKLAISKGLSAIGFDVAPDKVTNTDYLESTLGQGILNKAKTLGANPTDNDARIIRTIVGSIGKDPQALNKLIDHQDVMANRAISQHNKNYSEAKSRGFDAGFDLSVNPSQAGKAASKPIDSLPTANASNKGQRMRDTSTGQILRSNGLQWKAD